MSHGHNHSQKIINFQASFRRNDRRVKNCFFTKIRGRQTRRINQYLHKITKNIVELAKESRSAIILEKDINGIRKSYKKGNSQGNKFRRKLNSWSFYEFQRQIQHKAAWEGIRFHSLILSAPVSSVQYAEGHSSKWTQAIQS